ncbi:hypothetical protein [Methanoculleus chikugoensis]|uniref:hypothetical protein n=1 Tax=Methanoculleus chikugoensis TaxID=118126 RepID=UPI001FB4B9C5|nr:hypothetical protein [Methanoculleus chikugoensis]
MLAVIGDDTVETAFKIDVGDRSVPGDAVGRRLISPPGGDAAAGDDGPRRERGR